MKTKTDVDETATAEERITSDLVFNNDGLVADYLRNLMTAESATTTLHPGDVHLVHLAMEAGWKLSGAANAAGNSSVDFEIERAKVEVEVLRIENKNLKFKSELAIIDGEVFRSEQSNLKNEIGGLMGQLNEMKEAFGKMQIEISRKASRTEHETLNIEIGRLKGQLNEMKYAFDETNIAMNDLKSMLNEYQNNHTAAMTPTQGTAAHDGDQERDAEREHNVDPDVIEDSLTEMSAELDLKCVPQTDTSIDITGQGNEGPELPLALPQGTTASETIVEVRSDTATNDQKQCKSDNANFGSAPVTLSVPTDVVNERTIQNNSPEVKDDIRKPTVVDTPFRKAKPSPKIIKQHHDKKDLSSQEPIKAVKVATPAYVTPDKTSTTVEPKLNYFPQDFEAEPEVKQELEPDTSKETLHLDDVDGIDLEPAPVPKVIVRRNVKNYEDLQKEARSQEGQLSAPRSYR